MVQKEIEYMDLDQIAASGQCFTWRRLEGGHYAVTARGGCVEVVQAGHTFTFSCDRGEFDALWRDYFDLDTDYGAIQAAIDPEDGYLRAAARYGRGIRVLRQDLWEVLVSFLVSQNNNITRITRSIQGLAERWGEWRQDGERRWYAFPGPEELTAAAEADYAALGLGYRAKYLVRLVRQLNEIGYEGWASALKKADHRRAMETLTGLYGVGRKVAECVCLFGLHHVDAFPVDTHIRNALAGHYPEGFDFARYQGFAGILQQYLFYYDLGNGRRRSAHGQEI